MSPEKQQKLLQEFPDLLGKVCEFACGDGWYDLIYKLCADLIPLVSKETYVRQIKSKFGTLRFYINQGTEQIFRLIDAAELKSATVCEYCGANAKQVVNGLWVSTVCDECEKENYRNTR